MTLTRQQLELAADEVFMYAQNLFAYYLWISRVEPLLAGLPSPLTKSIVQNAVVESQVMVYRKLNEFFKSIDSRYPDDLKSELFGYAAPGGFMHDDDIKEIHKRIAHPTIRRAVQGDTSYDVYDASTAAFNHLIPFFGFISASFYAPDDPKSITLINAVNFLRKIWFEWSEKIAPEKRRKLV